MNIGDIFFNMRGEGSQLQVDAKKAAEAAASGADKSFKSKLGNLGKGAAIGAGIASFNLLTGAIDGAVGMLGDTIKAGSDLNETVSKIGVVFGDSSEDILAWGKTAATSLGMSRQEALDAAGTYGNLLVSLNVTGKAAGDMSKGMVQLASDLASFNNASPEDTLAAIQSGLVGESEPLRQFGINLSAAAVSQKALEMGLISTTKGALPDSVKAQATYALMLEQSKTAQGDFARTSGGLANQQRITDARMKDLSTTIGEKLLPVSLKIQEFISSTLVPAFIGIVDVAGQIFDALQPLINVAIPALKVAFEVAGKVITGVWNAIMAVIQPVIDAIKWVIDNLPKIQSAPGSLEFAPGVAHGGFTGGLGGSNVKVPGASGGTVGGFAAGGIVPGRMGAPMLAVVHGGEVITPVGGFGGSPVVIRVEAGGNRLIDYIDENLYYRRR